MSKLRILKFLLRRTSNPRWQVKIHDVIWKQTHEEHRRQPMITVEDMNRALQLMKDEGLGDAPVVTQVECTCPKPLLGAGHLCIQCRAASRVLLEESLCGIQAPWAEWLRGKMDVLKMPIELRELMERKLMNDVAPRGFLGRIFHGLKRPAVNLGNGVEPDLKNLFGHFGKEVSGDHCKSGKGAA